MKTFIIVCADLSVVAIEAPNAFEALRMAREQGERPVTVREAQF